MKSDLYMAIGLGLVAAVGIGLAAADWLLNRRRA